MLEPTLIVWHFMASLVNASEGEVTIFSDFAVLHATPFERLISSRSKFLLVRIFNRQTDGLASEPVTDVVYTMVSILYMDI